MPSEALVRHTCAHDSVSQTHRRSVCCVAAKASSSSASRPLDYYNRGGGHSYCLAAGGKYPFDNCGVKQNNGTRKESSTEPLPTAQQPRCAHPNQIYPTTDILTKRCAPPVPSVSPAMGPTLLVAMQPHR